jgi:adenylate cyclase
MNSRLAAGAAIAATATALAALAGQTTLGQIAEAHTFDWRLAAVPTPARADIAIVAINESSLRALAPIVGRWPWPRMIHAGVINYLARSGARAIVYDIQFGESDTQGQYRIGDRPITGAESDAELVAAVRQAGNVILLADALFEGLEHESGSLPAEPTADLKRAAGLHIAWPGLSERPSIHPPFPALLDAAAGVGHNLLQKDQGGVSRAIFPFLASGGVAVPSLGMAAALATGQIQPRDPLPLRPDNQLVLKIHGHHASAAAGTAFPVHSFFDVLVSEDNVQAGLAPPIKPEAFDGKLVFVGTTASGLADVHATAFGGSTPGVYLQATLADNVLSRDFIRVSAASSGVVIAAVAAVLAAAAILLLPAWWALGWIAAMAAAGILWATRLVQGGLWVPVFIPSTAAGLTIIGGYAWQYFVEGREKRLVRRLFGRYVSPAIFQQLMTNPAVARIGGERRVMSVLFSDIRGFTAASESGDAQSIVRQLNEYLAEMVAVLFRHEGTLDKFVGDQVMGLFGAPVADPRHADHAVAAAIDMRTSLDVLNARWTADGLPPFEIGIGVNSGEMIAGNIGSESIMSYTVIGDAVNLGARIESLNKELGTRILISQATRDLLTMPVETRAIGEVNVKGRREGVTVHEVIGTRT